MSRILKHIIAGILFASSCEIGFAEDSSITPFTVVVDPGHGGKDGGCSGRITNEKTIVLDVAKRFSTLINDSLPEVNVVLTRDNDRYITLQDRANIANMANGNLFVSIHVNSVDRRNRNRQNITGASVYALGLHKSDNNLSVAMRENSVMELEDDYSKTYQGFDPKSSESYIIFELSQNTHINKSIELADAIQHELITTAGREDKNVRQAGFWVLWATAMPAVLVELDFICNPEAERFMASSSGLDKMACSLFNAFRTYYLRHKSEAHGPRVGQSLSRAEMGIVDNHDAINEHKQSKKNAIQYHVQILTATKKIPKGDHEIKGVPDVNFFKTGKYYKYYSGSFNTQEEAKKHLKKLKKRFPKAFVIKTKDGKII